MVALVRVMHPDAPAANVRQEDRQTFSGAWAYDGYRATGIHFDSAPIQ